MASKTKIEYVKHSLNFWRGCTKVDECCLNCYAEQNAKMYGWDFTKVQRCSKQIWRQPITKSKQSGEYKWESGDSVFVCSISDFFHKYADQWRSEAWNVIRSRPDLTWIIVTKRLEQVKDHLPGCFNEQDYPNIMFMPTCGTQKMADERIPIALELKAKYPWIKIGVSIEPMLGEIDLTKLETGNKWPFKSETAKLNALIGGTYSRRESNPLNISARFMDTDTPSLDWVILGGESGPGARPMLPDWARSVRDQCKAAGVPFFMKQYHKLEYQKKTKTIKPKLIKDINQFPEDLRIREYPK